MRSSDMAINPLTGDFWQPSQPEYWECVAQAWREVRFYPSGKQRHIDEALAKAETLRAAPIRERREA